MSNVRSTEFRNILDIAIKSEGKIALPNVTVIEDADKALLKVYAAMGGLEMPYRFRVRDFDPPIGHQTHQIAYYPKIFLETAGMGGQFVGSGVILTANNGKAEAYSFMMCEHVWNESGANHSRGWHPKRCTKCGFDASIDSGD